MYIIGGTWTLYNVLKLTRLSLNVGKLNQIANTEQIWKSINMDFIQCLQVSHCEKFLYV